MAKILIVEDDERISRFLQLELSYEEHEVEAIYDGQEAYDKAIEEDYDIILLDIMIPTLNGLQFCRKFRKVKNTPIIMVTAKGDISDKVIGLDYGADDYIVKPIEIEELLARIRVILRRNEVIQEQSTKSTILSNDSQTLHFKDLIIDTQGIRVYINDEDLELTKTEYELLKLLIENIDIVMQREQILSHIWGYDNEVETNVVDVYIRYLRNKLKKHDYDKMIETVRGVGYVIRS
ncbi:response regulator transcription factor [Abyssicoccus albus]|uniref:Two-component system response regulator ArlR n=1 Tax=Abyssicoccus albus TaxID=1817405 RepID=A0A3N5BN32_9BACL|nr:response regulator transcription factor [Abyssicoccus albus]RPF57979.1 two-component system response regulator ArlR [Abyssicoccus albus]